MSMLRANLLRQVWPRRSAVVFDTGASGIRATQVDGPSRRPRLRDVLRISVGQAAGESESGAESDAPDLDQASLSARIARMIGQGRFAGRQVGLVLSPPEVRFHAMQMPAGLFHQPDEAIQQALAWEVAKEMRAEAKDLEVRYWRLPDGHRQRLNVMSVSMSASAARDWVDAFNAAGLDLARIDVSPCALLGLARHASPPDGRTLWGILDLGLRSTRLSVILDGTPVYIRSLSFSGRQLTEHIATAFDLPRPQAEALKCAHGMARDSGQAAHANDQITAMLTGVLTKAVDGLCHEIGRCFSYVSQNYVDVAVDRLVLAGGGAQMRGLSDYLTRRLELPVAPIRAALGGAKTVTPDAAAALGGALQDLEAA